MERVIEIAELSGAGVDGEGVSKMGKGGGMKCKGAECKEGKEICCFECKKFPRCKDEWKCDLSSPRPECSKFQ